MLRISDFFRFAGTNFMRLELTEISAGNQFFAGFFSSSKTSTKCKNTTNLNSVTHNNICCASNRRSASRATGRAWWVCLFVSLFLHLFIYLFIYCNLMAEIRKYRYNKENKKCHKESLRKSSRPHVKAEHLNVRYIVTEVD